MNTDTTILALLRTSTQPFHSRIEEIMSVPTDLPSHIRTLELFYGFIEPWEIKANEMLLPLQQRLIGRGKTDSLRRDLLDLEISLPSLSRLPYCDKLPTFMDVPTALGSMYVFEGATLGGQIIASHLESQLGMRDGKGYSYYRSYCDKVGLKWKEYGQILMEHCPPDSYDAVVLSACDTFDALSSWFLRFADARYQNEHSPSLSIKFDK